MRVLFANAGINSRCMRLFSRKISWKNFLLIPIFGAILSYSDKSDAQPFTGGILYEMCSSQDNDLISWCDSYTRGYLEGMANGQSLAGNNVMLCLPPGVEGGQRRMIVENNARNYPELLNKTASSLMVRSFLGVYRCKNGQKPEYSYPP